MQERVVLSLSQPRISLSAGGPPVPVTVTLNNHSNVVDQFVVTIEGAGADWFDLQPDRVSLFPGETGSVTLNMHPPRRENVHSGDYQLLVRATSRDDPSATAVAPLTMRISPSGGFQFQLLKARDVGREGAYSLRASNLSDAPLLVNLFAHDPETALTFYFPAPSLYLQPYEQQDMFFNVQAVRRPMKGEAVSYPFTVEAEPAYDDPTRAVQGTQRAQGEFVYQPKFRHWPWESLPRVMMMLVVLAGAGAALVALLYATDVLGKEAPPPREIGFGEVLATRDAASLAATQTQVAIIARTPTVTPTATTTATPTQTTTPTQTATPPPARTNTPVRTATRTP